MYNFRKDQKIYLKDIEYAVVSSLAGTTTLLENTETGERSNVSTFNLLTQYSNGELKFYRGAVSFYRASNPKSTDHARMDHLSEVARVETRRRVEYFVALDRMGSFDKCRAKLKKDIAKVSQDRGEERPPDVSTVYRWRKAYLASANDVRGFISRLDARGGKGASRLQSAVEAFIEQAIEEVALSQKRFSAEEVQDKLKLLVDKDNLRREDSAKLKLPSRRTICRRVATIPAYDIAVARVGKVEADRRFAHKGASRHVSRILEIVEIDHTPLDILVVDEKFDPIGRPMLTCVFERRSRCVLGYHLSLAGYGTASVFAAIRHALLPKTYLAELYPNDDLEWLCYGWFERIIMDNGSEFHADSVRDALLTLQIIVEFAKSRTPDDKPFVERFLKTLNYGFIHTLPGTTLEKVHKRVGFKAEEEATLTLDQVDRLLHIWICKKYHLRPHAGLGGRSPIDVWREGSTAHPPQLKMNAHDVEIELSECAESAVQQYGIDLNNFVYQCVQLSELRKSSPIGIRVHVKWSKMNVGHIWVWDPVASAYFRAYNKDEEFNGLTLEQAEAVQRTRKDGNSAYAQTRAEAGQVVRDMVEESKAAKKLAVRKKGARLNNERSAHSRIPEQTGPDNGGVDLDVAANHKTDSAATSGRPVAVAVELPPELMEG